MKSYKKNYIGKGTQVETKSGKVLDIVKVTLSVEEMMEFVHEYKEKEYITFEVATLRNADQFGHTHTVYTTTTITVEEAEEAPQEEKTEPEAPKKRKRRTKAQIEADNAKEVAEMEMETEALPF